MAIPPLDLPPMRVLIDGRGVRPEEAVISVFDWAVQRGDGCFEALRSYAGRPFAVGPHLDRLERSASALGLSLPGRGVLTDWIERVADDGGDCVIRVLVTRGGSDPMVEAGPRVVVLWEPVPVLPDAFRLLPMPAPWHPSGFPWPLAGVKSLSYGPNVAAQRWAEGQGYDDALLVGREGEVLEGPTSSVAWVLEGTLETAALDQGILASITRAVVLEEARQLDIPVREGRFPLQRLAGAEEVLVLSTVKEVRPVVAVGEWGYDPGPLTAKLAAAYQARVRGESP